MFRSFHHLPKVINSLSLKIQNNFVLPYVSYKKSTWASFWGLSFARVSSSNTLVGFSWNLYLPRHFYFNLWKSDSQILMKPSKAMWILLGSTSYYDKILHSVYRHITHIRRKQNTTRIQINDLIILDKCLCSLSFTSGNKKENHHHPKWDAWKLHFPTNLAQKP